MKKYIAYYRVSTQKQGQSGLGLEAQQASVAAYIENIGVLVSEYTEIESGKKDNRIQLALALAETKASGATLVIAKLDRLSRNVGFIFGLRDSKVDFVCADVPDMNTLSIGLFAVMAQHEREVISQRIKAALTAKKARGGTLGNVANFTAEGREMGKVTVSENARNDTKNRQAADIIKAKLSLSPRPSLTAIAAHLNEFKYTTRYGKPFTATQVSRLAKW